VHSWGLNSDGALGRSTGTMNAPPGPVSALPAAIAVAAGNGYMLALTQDGAVWGWGGNAAGQQAAGSEGECETICAESKRLRKRWG
jgi:Regulator of chromosome condensation (RCC1) repeat